MTIEQTLIEENIWEQYETFKKVMPDFHNAYEGVRAQTYKEGALSVKTKRLMAIAVATKAGCAGCMLAQTSNAIEAGASRDEIIEAIQVAICEGGTSTLSESLQIIQKLDEMGLLSSAEQAA